MRAAFILRSCSQGDSTWEGGEGGGGRSTEGSRGTRERGRASRGESNRRSRRGGFHGDTQGRYTGCTKPPALINEYSSPGKIARSFAIGGHQHGDISICESDEGHSQLLMKGIMLPRELQDE